MFQESGHVINSSYPLLISCWRLPKERLFFVFSFPLLRARSRKLWLVKFAPDAPTLFTGLPMSREQRCLERGLRL